MKSYELISLIYKNVRVCVIDSTEVTRPGAARATRDRSRPHDLLTEYESAQIEIRARARPPARAGHAVYTR